MEHKWTQCQSCTYQLYYHPLPEMFVNFYQQN